MSDHHPNDNNNNNNICFTNENYLNFIIVYLTVGEIVKLSLCNKQINKLLDPDNNKYINLLFLINLITKYFELDPSNNYIIKKQPPATAGGIVCFLYPYSIVLAEARGDPLYYRPAHS